MGLSYTVQKNKLNRYSYRAVGILFALVGVLGFVLMWKIPKYRFLVAAVGIIAILYGVYMIKASLRLQAYDITYHFIEEGIRLQTKRGEFLLPYDEIRGVQWIEPSPDMDYCMIQIRHTKRQYVLHFTNHRKFAERIFAYLQERVPAMKL